MGKCVTDKKYLACMTNLTLLATCVRSLTHYLELSLEQKQRQIFMVIRALLSACL